MKIIIEVDCAINGSEAQEYVEYLNEQPWVKLAYIQHCNMYDKKDKPENENNQPTTT